jgi:GH25 family lysozyme M1 (1,4-beta-N-acetylmuramidase)
MRPDTIWHYKHLFKQFILDIKSRINKVNIQALAASWEVVIVDLSYWQGDIDFAKLATKVDGVIIRAGYGNDYFDPRVDEYVRECKKYKIPFGLYWYVKAGKDFIKHAENFHIKWVENPGNLHPTFDLEESGGLGKTALESWWQKMYNEFMRLSGLSLEKIITYTSPGFLNRVIGLTNWLKLTLLWVAHWTTASQPLRPNEWLVPNKPWKLWQWSATGKGSDYGVSSRYIDLDRYNGTKTQFYEEFGITPPIPPGEDDMLAKVTAVPHLNVRTNPGTNYPDVGDLLTNSIFKVKTIVNGTVPACSIWLQIKEGEFIDKWVCMFDGNTYLAEIII